MTELNDVKEAVRPDGDRHTAVLIVGAGPVGLTLACDLARRGVRFRIIEQSGTLFPGSRGKGLQPRTLEVLDDLGIGAAVQRESGRYPRMLAWEGSTPGETFDMIARGAPRPGAPYGEGRMLPQWRTQELLYGRLRTLGGHVEFGTRLTGLRQDADGVSADLATGGGELTAGAGFVIAADGGRSTVRTALGIGMTGETVDPRPMLVADVRLTGLDRDHWHVWPNAEGGTLALCPLHGTELFQLAAQFTDESAQPEASPEAVRTLIGDRSALSAADVQEVRWVSSFRVRAALADRFRHGRVFLAGDAAHVHSPAGGQGLNTGIQDAYNLGWKLGQVLRHGADTGLLDSYEKERLPPAAEVLGLSTRLHRREQSRGRETHQLDIDYRDGPLAHELRAGPPGELRAGDRAPDSECVTARGERLRLFDALHGPHWTLLAVGGARLPGRVPAGVRAWALSDVEEHAELAYGSGLFLIRPDGYVAAASDKWGGPEAELLDRLGLR